MIGLFIAILLGLSWQDALLLWFAWTFISALAQYFAEKENDRFDNNND